MNSQIVSTLIFGINKSEIFQDHRKRLNVRGFGYWAEWIIDQYFNKDSIILYNYESTGNRWMWFYWF
jgi:hypothetical protein